MSYTSHYYSCISSRRKRAKCTVKKSVKKQYLEDLVLQAIWNILSDAGIVHMIAETIVKLHEKECKENATLKALEAKRNTATKASKNLITAIEQGIITEQTKIRLKELETEISELSVAIEQEKLHSDTYLTVSMIEEFLRSATIGDIQDTNVRKHIVNTFIREVIYYPDKIIITLNFTDNYDKPELTSEHIENIEKQSESETAFSLPQSSNKFTSFPPNKSTLPQSELPQIVRTVQKAP